MAKYAIDMKFAAERIVVDAPSGREISAEALWELGDAIVAKWNVDFPLGGEDEWEVQNVGQIDEYVAIPRPS